jgi:hypothetical protein
MITYDMINGYNHFVLNLKKLIKHKDALKKFDIENKYKITDWIDY